MNLRHVKQICTLLRSCRPLAPAVDNLTFGSLQLRRKYTVQTTLRPWGPPPKDARIHVCMSGGVDSSVTARLLLDQGYDIYPVYMRNWETLDENSDSGGCEWERDWDDVQQVCRKNLGGVKPRLVDLSREYWMSVFQPALDDWARGVTPNPDVTCNREIKFKALPDLLLAEDPTSWLATGHYARLFHSPFSSTDCPEPALYRARHLPKDQSYYLSTSPIAAFRRTLFPLGEYTKQDVREMARKWELHTSERKESMGICFVGERKRFGGFLDEYLEPKPGDIEDESGKVVGKHNGVWQYTIGEGARLGGFPQRMFIGAKDSERNVITIVPADSPLLQCEAVTTRDFRWISPSSDSAHRMHGDYIEAIAQTRSLQPGGTPRCKVRKQRNDSLLVSFNHTISGVSSGQTVVLYDGDHCLGGGTIDSTVTKADSTTARDDSASTASPLADGITLGLIDSVIA